ncbi:MAG: DUF4363 family protein [Ruminococcaceae bacterium]|nr:DUF4363 family protein [Oscillospiraceae bacterium]
MKRGIIAIMIFLICFTVSVYCTKKNEAVLNSTKEKINEIRLFCENSENEKAMKKANELKEEWEKDRIIIEVTLERTNTRQIETAVILLPLLLENGKTDKAVEHCYSASSEIDYILDKEKVNFENIF